MSPRLIDRALMTEAMRRRDDEFLRATLENLDVIDDIWPKDIDLPVDLGRTACSIYDSIKAEMRAAH